MKFESWKKRISRVETRYALLLPALLSSLAVAEARQAAPRFTASTLSGMTFTNDSLRGQVTLLQFWATWCSYCRRDEPVLENLTRDFAGQGLVVLAVSVGETGETVKKYLEEHPRSCQIVLAENTNLVAEYAPRSFPLYVLIDRDGKVVGTQRGAGGELALRDLLSRAGLGDSPVIVSRRRGRRASISPAAYPAAGKVIVVPQDPDARPHKPLPPTVFVLKNGEKLEDHRYLIRTGTLRIAVKGEPRAIPLAALDLEATVAANHERGIDVKFPTKPGEAFLSF